MARTPGKRGRGVQVIDLTNDDADARSSKTPKVSSGQTACRPILSDEDDEYSDDVLDSQDALATSTDQDLYMHYGTWHTSIVGCRFYNGLCVRGEMVLVRRDPNNRYDTNAIRVLNASQVQIGHVPKLVAAKLSPFMDRRELFVEGLITGQKGYYDCPLDLQLYGTADPIRRAAIFTRMQEHQIPLTSEPSSFHSSGLPSLSQGQVEVSSAAMDATPQELQYNRTNPGATIEQFGTKEADLEKLPMAEQPDGLAVPLLPYQLQGLKWMLDKELPKLPRAGSQDVVQMWRRSQEHRDSLTNVATNYTLKASEVELASGGILADDMGLGKTIQVISLMLAGRALPNSRASDASDATLILAPLSVMSNWSLQMGRHVQKGYEMRVLTYHGTRKEPISPKTIGNYDCVVTTYETVMSEFWSREPKLKRKHGLYSVKWRRVVVDEGHTIRNANSKKAVAATQLQAQSRWALTGTPIINSLKDLYSLVKFLRLSGGLDRFELFNSSIIRPVNQGAHLGKMILQTLMQSICLRRTKDMPFVDLRLPKMTEYVHRIEFLPHEWKRYSLLEAEAKGKLETYRQQMSEGGRTAFKAYSHVLEVLLRLRQTCNHWKLCGEKRVAQLMEMIEKESVVDLTPENIEALQKMLQVSIDSQDDCPICLDTLKSPIITCCAHVFCFMCIERVIENQKRCPLCRADLPSFDKLVRPMKEQEQQPEIDIDTGSSKIEALLKILEHSREKDGTKTIVFSQWTSFLDIVQGHLGDCGFNFTRIDGRMSAIQRDRALDLLENDPTCTIMLASLNVCSVGLNLVAANQVILCDSWWAPAIEDQAVDRVHRLGQKKPTTVFRLVMEHSIENRVLAIQEEKRNLVSQAFSEKNKRGSGARVADIARILG